MKLKIDNFKGVILGVDFMLKGNSKNFKTKRKVNNGK